jgi:hypothetical protein
MENPSSKIVAAIVVMTDISMQEVFLEGFNPFE